MATDVKDMGTAGLAEEPEAQEPLVETLTTSMTALGTAEAGTLSATQSAIGSATVSGDADVSASAVGMLSAKGSAGLKMGAAGAVIAEKDATVSQGGAALVIGDKVTMERSLGGAVVAGEADVRHGTVVLLLSRKTTMSEDSRVLFDWKAALILAAVVLGFAGIAAVLGFMLVRKGAQAAQRLSTKLPHLPELPHLAELPHLPDWVHALDRLRKSA